MILTVQPAVVFLLIVALVFYAFDLTPTRASVFLAIDLRRKMSKVINFYARFIYESEKEKYKNNKKKNINGNKT